MISLICKIFKKEHNSNSEKEVRFVGTREGVEGGRTESGQNVQTFPYKINKYWRCNVQCNDYQ